MSMRNLCLEFLWRGRKTERVGSKEGEGERDRGKERGWERVYIVGHWSPTTQGLRPPSREHAHGPCEDVSFQVAACAQELLVNR